MTSDQEPRPYVMIIDKATVEQCWDIGKYCGSIGVTGVFKLGTLEEVYERESGVRKPQAF